MPKTKRRFVRCLADGLNVGLDVHKDSIVIAVAEAGRGRARVVQTVGGDWRSLVKVLERLEQEGHELRIFYEAGPTGYELHRRLSETGYHCEVVAPSLAPRKPGERVKVGPVREPPNTDRRDAAQLATSLRAGDLTPVSVPDEDIEALRDLRARPQSRQEVGGLRSLTLILSQGSKSVRPPQKGRGT